MKIKAEVPSARYAYEGLDRVIHERARLSVLTSLITHPHGVAFGDLKDFCGLTDGNLNRHLKVLEEEGMVQIERTVRRNRPLTTYFLTAAGRLRYLEYLSTLEQVVRDAASHDTERRRAPGTAELCPSTS